MAADLPQRQQVLLREEAPLGQRGVQAGGGVALGQDKAVPVLPLGVLGVHIQLLAVQVGEQVGGGQAAAGVARLGGVGPLDDPHPDLTGGGHQLLFFFFGHVLYSSSPNHSAAKRYSVVCRYSAPAGSTVLGKLGWWGESG